jgi:hypothetical protein
MALHGEDRRRFGGTRWRRRGLAFAGAVIASLALAGGAEADITVGEVAPPNPESWCNLGPTDTIQLGTTGGNIYRVPVAGTLTSWSTDAGPGAGQYLSMKVYGLVGKDLYKVVAEDGPRALTPSTLDTFPIDVPVEAGDVIGLNDHEAPTAPDACAWVTPSVEDVEGGLLGDHPDGTELTFAPADTEPERRVNISADLVPTLVEVPPVLNPTPTSGGSGPTSGPPTAGPPAPRCLVPRLGAKKLKAARKALKAADCRLGRVSRSGGASARTGVVASQNPQTGKKLPAGTKVAVKLVPPISG